MTLQLTYAIYEMIQLNWSFSHFPNLTKIFAKKVHLKR